MAAVNRLFVGEPYACGATLTLADFYTFYTFGLASMITKAIFGTDLLADSPKISAVMALMAEHPSVAQVESERAGG